MIIDFHTHVFPDAVAPRGLKVLTQGLLDHGEAADPVTDMTVLSLISYMKTAGVDLSVVQPIATSEAQFSSINKFAEDITGRGEPSAQKIVSFGSIYPSAEDYKSQIDCVVAHGLKGIKLHPEYQNFWVDDKLMLEVYDYALSRGLMILFHAGEDGGYFPPYKSDPERFKNVLLNMGGKRPAIILAHLGSFRQWDDVERHLVGLDVYFDTSMGFSYYSAEQFVRIAKAHGDGKILFGSDSPWSDAVSEITAIRALPLPDEAKANILGLNAARLLGIG